MRKYSQLCLVLITIASIIVLLMYRNEYRQLKYVLDVVNFIGRKDELALVHLENETSVYQQTLYQFDEPLPIWQRIGNDFQAYSAFWIKPNELRSGGEAIAIVASLKHAIVRFKCELQYANGQMQKGKFVFMREDIVADGDTGNANGPSDDFIVYKFVCKVTKEFGRPAQIVFTDLNANTRHRLPLRHLQQNKVVLLTMTMCVNLVSRNNLEVDAFSTDFNLLQFFLHHQLIGIDEFLVYGSSKISPALKRALYLHGIKFNLFPFNFPYDVAHSSKIQTLIRSDCLLRTSNAVKYTILLTPHDFVYMESNLMAKPHPLLQLLKDPSYGSNAVQYDIVGNPICRHASKTILSDNLMLSANASADYSKVTLYKTNAIFTKNQNVALVQHPVTARLQKTMIFYNHYKDCDQMDQSTGGNLVDWRTLISTDFRQYVDQIGVNINAILQNEH